MYQYTIEDTKEVHSEELVKFPDYAKELLYEFIEDSIDNWKNHLFRIKKRLKFTSDVITENSYFQQTNYFINYFRLIETFYENFFTQFIKIYFEVREKLLFKIPKDKFNEVKFHLIWDKDVIKFDFIKICIKEFLLDSIENKYFKSLEKEISIYLILYKHKLSFKGINTQEEYFDLVSNKIIPLLTKYKTETLIL